MESLIVRRLCYLHVKQVSKGGQPWRQLTTLNKRILSSTSIMNPRTYCTKSDEPSNKPQAGKLPPDIGMIHEEAFISPKGRPKKKAGYSDHLNKEEKEDDENSKKLMIGALAAVVLMGGVLYYSEKKQKARYMSELKKSVAPKEKVLIGGSWELTNQYGKKMSDQDFLGEWCLVYFGFTHCPDICPDELEKIGEVVDMLDKVPKLPKLRALFITIDPERDSMEAIKDYLAEFSAKFIGLTGSWEELEKILKGYKVYYSMGPKDEDGDYIVDHSIITYLMNPDGLYESHFARNKTNVEIANIIERKMSTWRTK